MTSDQPTPPPADADAQAESQADAQIEAEVEARVNAQTFDDAVSLRRRVLNVRTIGSLVFGLLLLFLLFRVVFGEDFDWGEVIRLIGDADPTFLLLAFLAYYATFPLRGFRWKYVLAKTGTEVKFKDATEILYLSWFVNCLVPAKLGDLYRAYLLRGNYNASLSRTVGTVFVERIADIIIIALLALTAGYWSFRGRSRPEIDLIFVIGIVVAISMTIMLIVLRFGGARLDRFMPVRLGEYWTRFREGSTSALGARSLPDHPHAHGLHLAARGNAPVLRHPGAGAAGGRARDQRIGLRGPGGGAADRDPAHAGRIRLRGGRDHRRPGPVRRSQRARHGRGPARPSAEHRHGDRARGHPVRLQPEDPPRARGATSPGTAPTSGVGTARSVPSSY